MMPSTVLAAEGDAALGAGSTECHVTHDEACGYKEAVEGADCKHICEKCVVKDSDAAESDLVGRIGGDEFLVYLPEVESEDAALWKVEKLHAALGLLTPEQGAPPSPAASAWRYSPTVQWSMPIYSGVLILRFMSAKKKDATV